MYIANAIFNFQEYSFFACNMLKVRKLAVGWALINLKMLRVPLPSLEPPEAFSTYNQQKFMQL